MRKEETLSTIRVGLQRGVTGLVLVLIGMAGAIALSLALRLETAHVGLWALLYMVTVVFAIDYRGARKRGSHLRSWLPLLVLLGLFALLGLLHGLHAPAGHVAQGDAWTPRPDLPAHLHARGLLVAAGAVLLVEIPVAFVLRRREREAARRRRATESTAAIRE